MKPHVHLSENYHSFTISCHHQTYEKLSTEPTKIGHILENIVSTILKIKFLIIHKYKVGLLVVKKIGKIQQISTLKNNNLESKF